MEGARTWKKRRERAPRPTAAPIGRWPAAGTRPSCARPPWCSTATPPRPGWTATPPALSTIAAEADEAGGTFVAGVAAELEVAHRPPGRTPHRLVHPLAIRAPPGRRCLRSWSARLGKNFFYDSWLASPQVEVYGLDFYLLSGFWLLLWCVLLLWAFTTRLRRGLRREIDQLAEGWKSPKPAEGIFARLESDCRRIHRFRHELERLEQHVATLRRRLALPDEQLGQRR